MPARNKRDKHKRVKAFNRMKRRQLVRASLNIENDNVNVLETPFLDMANFQATNTRASQEWLSDLNQEQEMTSLIQRMNELLASPTMQEEKEEKEKEIGIGKRNKAIEAESRVETETESKTTNEPKLDLNSEPELDPEQEQDDEETHDYDAKYDVLSIENLDLFAHSDAFGSNYNGLSCIYPGLYLSGSNIATNVRLLAKTGITAVLRIMITRPGPKLLDRYKGAGIQHVLFLKQDVSSKDPISKHFDTSFSFINNHMMKQRGRVLVHCRLGKERSATIVMHFLQKYLYLHDKLAWAYCRIQPILDLVELCVKIRRRCVKPPSFFRNELRHYEQVYRDRGVPPL